MGWGFSVYSEVCLFLLTDLPACSWLWFSDLEQSTKVFRLVPRAPASGHSQALTTWGAGGEQNHLGVISARNKEVREDKEPAVTSNSPDGGIAASFPLPSQSKGAFSILSKSSKVFCHIAQVVIYVLIFMSPLGRMAGAPETGFQRQ